MMGERIVKNGDADVGHAAVSDDHSDGTERKQCNIGEGSPRGNDEIVFHEKFEESDAVRLVDEELMEVRKMLALQQRKVDALERLRLQYLNGER